MYFLLAAEVSFSIHAGNSPWHHYPAPAKDAPSPSSKQAALLVDVETLLDFLAKFGLGVPRIP